MQKCLNNCKGKICNLENIFCSYMSCIAMLFINNMHCTVFVLTKCKAGATGIWSIRLFCSDTIFFNWLLLVTPLLLYYVYNAGWQNEAGNTMAKMRQNKQTQCRFRLFATALGRQHSFHSNMHLPLAKWTFLRPSPLRWLPSRHPDSRKRGSERVWEGQKMAQRDL